MKFVDYLNAEDKKNLNLFSNGTHKQKATDLGLYGVVRSSTRVGLPKFSEAVIEAVANYVGMTQYCLNPNNQKKHTYKTVTIKDKDRAIHHYEFEGFDKVYFEYIIQRRSGIFTENIEVFSEGASVSSFDSTAVLSTVFNVLMSRLSKSLKSFDNVKKSDTEESFYRNAMMFCDDFFSILKDGRIGNSDFDIGLDISNLVFNGMTENIDVKEMPSSVPLHMSGVDFNSSFFTQEISYILDENRQLTQEEQKLVPKIADWYIMPKEVLEICKLAKKTRNGNLSFKNFMLRGPAGTGKTESAKAIASKLNLPYVYITCSADTEIFDLFGQPMPNKDGVICYVDTPFIQALKNGWVVEIQEPAIIAKEGVLVGLNGILDTGATLVLPTGEIVERHPDAIVICTTNVDYYGCNNINQSVLSRMNCVYDIDEPSIDIVVKRVMAITNFSDENMVKKVAITQEQIRNKLQADDVDDGVCGTRELIDCITIFSLTKNIRRAMETTVVSKATAEKEMQLSIMEIVEGAFC